MRSINDINHEIIKLQNEIEKLNKEKTDLVSMPEDVRMAEFLHSKLCRSDHVEGCSWQYDNWKKIPLDSNRQKYLNKAQALLMMASYNIIEGMINIITKS